MNELYSIHIDKTHDGNKLIVEIDIHTESEVYILPKPYDTMEDACAAIIKFLNGKGFLK